MIEVTVFTNFKDCRGNMLLTEITENILNGKYETPVNLHRSALEAGDKETAEHIKKSLSAFTVSATYQSLRRKGNMTGYNPLQILDIDNLDPADIPRLRQLINEAPYTVYSFLSPGGRGLKVIVYSAVAIEMVADNHRVIYNTLKDWYADLLHVEIDASGSDAGRLCFVSYDPDLYASPRFDPWMRTGEGLPDNLLMLPPQTKSRKKAGATQEASMQLIQARKRMDKQLTYNEGNRNNYVYRFACLCNRMGIAPQKLIDYCSTEFTDLPAQECNNAVASAYNNAEDYNTEAQCQSGKRVELIQKYLSAHFLLRKNVVRGLVEYHEKSKRNKDFIPVTDYWENTIWCDLQLRGVFCKISELRSVIHSSFSKEYDPFKSYFSKLPPWDGETDYIAQLAATVSTDNPDYWLNCLRKWLVATVACAIDEGQENHTVLLLSGDQGLGKTTWCRNLVPPELHQYTYSGNIDPSSKDCSLLLSDCFLIVLDELSGQSRPELNRLKTMITKDYIRERRAYARNAETYERRASFAATVNDSQVLTDRTGSRRFLCFEAKRIDYLSPVDHKNIFSQALAMYKAGFKFWFSEGEITEVNNNNESFQQNNPEEELFYAFFRKPDRFERPQLLSSSEIIAKIAEKTRLPITPINVNNLGKMLKRARFEYITRRGTRLFGVIELTFDEVKAVQRGITSYNDEDDQTTKDQEDTPRDKPDERGGNEDPTLPL